MANPKEEKTINSVVGRKVKVVELGSNAEGIGNVKTVNETHGDMVMVFEGVLVTAKRTGNLVLLPNANLKLVKF